MKDSPAIPTRTATNAVMLFRLDLGIVVPPRFGDDGFTPWVEAVLVPRSSRAGGCGACSGRNRLAYAPPALLRMRGCRAQDGVILAKDPIILLSVVLMALVARGGSVLGHLRL